MAVRNWLERFVANTPLRKVANVRQQNRIANVIEGIEGLGCKIVKPLDAEGWGWRIEVGNGSDIELPPGYDDGLYHFEVLWVSDTTVTVRGGWWALYEGEVRTQVDLDDGSVGTITDYNDLLEVDIDVTAAGFIYLELDNTGAPTLDAIFAASIPADSTDIYRKKIATIGWAASAITTLQQDWRGGNVLSGAAAEDVLDEVSIDRNDSEEVQVYNWDNASNVAPAATDLFPYKSAGGTAKYATAGAIVNEGSDSIDWEELPLDEQSIDFSAIDKVQLNDWATAVPHVDLSGVNDMMAVKRYVSGDVTDPESYNEILAYINFGSVMELGTVHTNDNFADTGDGWAAKGTGKSGGNTDHDDTYWHAYNEGTPVGAPDFVDLKDYRTSGDVQVDKMQANNATAAGDGTGALLVPNGGAYFGDGVWADKGAALQAGRFYDGANTTSLCNGTSAIDAAGDVKVAGGDITVTFGDMKVGATGDYYHGVDQGVSITDRVGGGIDIGSTHEIEFQNLLPTDKILVRR